MIPRSKKVNIIFDYFLELIKLITFFENFKNKQTGRVKGFGFVEFDDMEVAEIAARTMNNYILFDRSLKCSVVTDTSRYNLLFKKCNKKFQFHNKYNQYLFDKNKVLKTEN